MKKILIPSLIIIVLIIVVISLVILSKPVEFKDREAWLESTPTAVPWEDLDLELLKKDKATLYWTEDIDFDDSVAGIKHRLDVEKIGGEWKIMWYGKQYKCAREGMDEWQNTLCP